MALPQSERVEVRSLFAQRVSGRVEAMGLNRPDLDAAIAAIDDWIDANAASFNSSLPQPARAVLTASQKSELFSLVSAQRYQNPPVE